MISLSTAGMLAALKLTIIARARERAIRGLLEFVVYYRAKPACFTRFVCKTCATQLE